MAPATSRACQFCRPPYLPVPTSTPPISDQDVAVRQALARLRRLDPLAAQAIELRHLEGLTLPEIQNQLKLSPSQLRRRIRAAAAWLKHHIPTAPAGKSAPPSPPR